jgi:exopolyphosphatase/guanosine-5'-triphosphate,3'-diphosphate pyrophosphatase
VSQEAPARSRRVAAVDCGTNSIRLLLAERDGDAGLVDLDRRVEIVRLGQGVDATGQFHPDALARTFAVTEQYADLIRDAGVTPDAVRFIATSAARDAGNRDTFFDGIRQRLGVEVEVIDGATEAALSFSGALSRVVPTGEPVLVMDIGGGSTELVVGSAIGEIEQAVSLDIGSVRLTERFLRAGPPEPAALEEATRFIDTQLDQSGLELGRVRCWVGVAGTVTTIAAVQLGLETYDRARVHGSLIARADLQALLDRLSAMQVSEIRALPSMHPQRADVITAGTLIAARVARLVSAPELVVSESDILDGIALELLRALQG